MACDPVPYRRAKYSATLFRDRLYTAGHAWLKQEEGRIWRVGFTNFAVRMLGEMVEMDFEVAVGENVKKGQEVGWIEGFKAISDIFSPMDGIFRGGNEALLNDPDLLRRAPFLDGWLFRLEGEPGADCLDLDGYAAILDGTIDSILAGRHTS